LNPLLPRPKGAKDAEGMKSKFLAVILFTGLVPVISVSSAFFTKPWISRPVLKRMQNEARTFKTAP